MLSVLFRFVIYRGLVFNFGTTTATTTTRRTRTGTGTQGRDEDGDEDGDGDGTRGRDGDGDEDGDGNGDEGEDEDDNDNDNNNDLHPVLIVKCISFVSLFCRGSFFKIRKGILCFDYCKETNVIGKSKIPRSISFKFVSY